ncbi:MAG: DNA repair protein RecO [Clostridiales bacterium]|nr:DNA repair protein RecO [Clostridiales bacterium]
MKFKTHGLVIYEKPAGETDRYVSILTKDRGVIHAFVRGAYNLKSPKSAATRLLCYSDFIIYEGKGNCIVDSAESKEMFIALRKDIVKTALAQYFCQLCYELCSDNAYAGSYLRTVLNSLYMLCKGDKELSLIKAVFELRMLALSGYMPDLKCCKVCGKFEDEEMRFSPDEGCLYCGDCLDNMDNYGIKTGLGATAAMRHAIYADDKKIFAFNLSGKSLEVFANAAESYTVRKTEKRLPTLDFYKTLSTP